MVNPVLRREVKTLFRSWKIFISLALYTFILGLFTAMFLFIFINTSYNGFDPKNILAVYLLMSGFQMAFIILTVPGFTGNAISGEKERQTLDLMLITKMSSRSIIIGKLLSSLIIVVFMIIVSMPVYAVIFYYGGVSISGFFITILFCIINAMSIGSISIFFSTIYKKTVASIISTHLVIYFLSGGTLIISGIIYSIFYIRTNAYLPALIYIIILAGNPFLGFASIVDSQLGTSETWDLIGNFSYISTNSSIIGSNSNGYIEFWHLNVLFNIIITIIFIALSAYRVNPVNYKKRHKNKK